MNSQPSSQKGFIGSLFDFSFSSFIATKLIKVLYGLSMLGSAVVALVLIVGGFGDSMVMGLFTLFIIAPLAFFAMIIYARIMMEMMIVLFRISENLQELADRTKTSEQP